MKKRFRLRAYCYDSKGRLISTGENNYGKSHPLQAHFAKLVGQEERIYLHAEIHAILRAKDREIFSIKVERFDNQGKPVLSYPCPVCRAAIKAFGIKKIWFTTPDGISVQHL